MFEETPFVLYNHKAINFVSYTMIIYVVLVVVMPFNNLKCNNKI